MFDLGSQVKPNVDIFQDEGNRTITEQMPDEHEKMLSSYLIGQYPVCHFKLLS